MSVSVLYLKTIGVFIICLSALAAALGWHGAARHPGILRVLLVAAGSLLPLLALLLNAAVLSEVGMRGIFINHINPGWGLRVLAMHLLCAVIGAVWGWEKAHRPPA